MEDSPRYGVGQVCKPMKMKNLVFALGIAGLVWGCGGGGGGTAVTTGSVRTFVTDGMDDNLQVWVKIYSIKLTSATGTVTLFDDANGQILDVRSLRDASGQRFSLINSKSIPTGTYTGATIVVSKDFSVLPNTGTSTLTAKQFSDDGGGKKNITVTFSPSLTIGSGTNNVVLDFDLASWTDGATVSPVVKHERTHSGLDDKNRHEDEDYHGVVSGLTGTAPVQSFSMGFGTGTITVVTSASTNIFTQSGTASSSMANGQRVEVVGAFNSTTGNLEATSIKIEDESSDHHRSPEIQGTADNLNETAGTFDITIEEAHNFIPSKSTYPVQTDSSTVFRSHAGAIITKTEFFAFAATHRVEVEGTVTDGTFIARKAKVEDGGGDGSEDSLEAKGTPSNVNSENSTFNLALLEWSGFNGSSGQSVKISATNATIYENDGGDEINAATFFSAITSPAGITVKVHGHWTDGGIEASRLRIRSNR